MKLTVKIGSWIVGIVILALIVIIGPEYKLTTTYPAACWTDDGKQIVYLEYRELSQSLKLAVVNRASRTLKSTTYLMIMDADGKNKKMMGEVPDFTDEQKDKLSGGELPKNEFNNVENKKNDFYMKNLSKKDYEKLRFALSLKGSDQQLKIEQKKDLPEAWKRLPYSRYLEISPDSKYLLYIDSRYGLVVKNLTGKEKIIDKITYQRKSYLFIPFWWRV
jgi:hypothetical protein